MTLETTAFIRHSAFDDVVHLLRGRTLAALTGAGCSTDSGIPDYRGPTSRARARTPIQHHEFLTRPEVRARYWLRSAIGWPRIRSARPNEAHHALARLERAGVLRGLVTQNVDRLHHTAGSTNVVELHGALAEVRCLSCGTRESRDALQTRLLDTNPSLSTLDAMARPDGDAEIDVDAVGEFRIPDCLACGGVLKPDVVFFGGNVPRDIVDRAYGVIASAEALVVAGSSLTVYSGFRFVRFASERGVPIVIVNDGETRGDAYATAKLEARLGEVLPRLAEALTGS